MPEVWQTSGFGTIFCARRRPDGAEVWGLAVISLSDGGIAVASGGRVAPPGEHRRWRRDLGRLDLFPASREMPEGVAADYLYGACALGYGNRPPERWPREVAQVAALLPAPPGGPDAWRHRLVGPDGMTPPRLVRIVREHGRPPDLPDGQDLAIVTTVAATLPPGTGPALVRRVLARRGPPKFVDMGRRGDARILEWVKPYASGMPVPQGHKVSVLYADSGRPDSATIRILTAGGHQGMGQLAVCEDRVEAEAMTLSRASVLVSTLLASVDGPVTITETNWRAGLQRSRK
jgi:hypothetical protein